MKRVTSFKAQYRQAPVRAVTPPPPTWEPLSPVLRPSDVAAARPAQPLPPHSLPLGSPIGALADAAVSSQRPYAAYAEPPRRASHAGGAPPAGLQPSSERAPKHAFATGHTHSNHERPAKRARSEYHTSPPYGPPQSRPATSHIPGYNVEHMVASGMRMYQDSRANAPPHTNGSGDKMLSDAELLLFFSNVSAHTAQTPPSTAKRWSVSQPSPPELPLQQAPQMHASVSPRAAVINTASDQTLHQHAPLDVKPPTELPPFPPETPDATSTSQTRTPPAEAVVDSVAQPSMQEVAPAEEPKPKKQQAVPKGRSRGTRSTPSTGKRKRSTPKPKNAPSTSASAVPDQLQSPQSLPADQSLVMANVVSQTNGQSHLPNSHNRRHSFSTPTSMLPSDAVPSLSFRAQSVPLGGDTVLSAPAVDLRQLPKKTAV